MPRVSVVIATRDRPAMVRHLLREIRPELRPGDELIVVDSASEDPAVFETAVEEGAIVLRCEEPGSSRARNAGWKAAGNELIAFTDDDCVPNRHWIVALSGCFGGRPDIDFATGPVFPEVPIVGRARLGLSLFETSQARTFHQGDDPATMGHGANMAFRRAVLERLGGFDECLGPGTQLRAAEDQDLIWRALEGGSTGLLLPEAVVLHHQWRGRLAALRTTFDYGVGSGASLVKRRRMGCSPEGEAGPLSWGDCATLLTGERGLSGGLVRALRHASAGFEMGALAELVKSCGVVVGCLSARARPLARGSFRSR